MVRVERPAGGGMLGLRLGEGKAGRPVVLKVVERSAAAGAGVKAGWELCSVGDLRVDLTRGGPRGGSPGQEAAAAVKQAWVAGGAFELGFIPTNC